MRRGDIYWASLRAPRGSEPGYRRPVVVVQADSFNESRIATAVCATVTSNLRLGEAPGNVRLERRSSGLNRRSVVNVSQLLTLNRSALTERAGRLDDTKMNEVDQGLRLVLGLR